MIETGIETVAAAAEGVYARSSDPAMSRQNTNALWIRNDMPKTTIVVRRSKLKTYHDLEGTEHQVRD